MRKHLRYPITILAGALIVMGVCAYKNIFQLTEPARIFRALCDGFFLAGVLLTGAGLMVLVGNNGLFDTLAYASRSFFRLFVPGLSREQPKMSFADYRREKHQSPGAYWFLVIVGSAFLACAFLFLALFTNASATAL